MGVERFRMSIFSFGASGDSHCIFAPRTETTETMEGVLEPCEAVGINGALELVGPATGDEVAGPSEEPVGCRAAELPVTAGMLLEVC